MHKKQGVTLRITKKNLKLLIQDILKEEIRKVKGGWKVYPKKPKKGEKRRKALSKKPLTYKKALAQFRAIELSKRLGEENENNKE